MIKKNLAILSASLVLISISSPFAAANDEISIFVNGAKIESDTAPVIINDRTMLPVRAVAESLDCDVIWDDENQGIVICRNLHLYNFWIGYDSAFDVYNNALEDVYSLDSAPTIINDRTMLPVRAVAELMNADISWDASTRTINITVANSEPYDISGYESQFIAFEAALCDVRDKYRKFANNQAETITGKIILESGESMDFVLYPELAESTVKNFVELAESGFYNNTIFHRVIKNFVIQGGGFFKLDTDEKPVVKESPTITGEFLSNGYMNLLPHTTAALSMARTNDPNSASSQFFICDDDCVSLNGSYAVFGYITSNEDLIHRIASVQTDENDCPTQDVIIKEIIIE